MAVGTLIDNWPETHLATSLMTQLILEARFLTRRLVGTLFIIILSQFNVALIHEEENDADFITSDGRPQVEVRAVFINCEPEVLSVAPETEVTRFQRDELFKHNVLKDCSKKLALTVKITSESGNFGDEYLPIEHVFEGSSEKRVRLLDPYILRLRRDMPRQAYMLRRLDTVTCVIANDAINENNFGTSRSRIQREVEPYSKVVNSGSDPKSELDKLTPFKSLTLMSTVMIAHDLDKIDNNHVCSSNNSSLNTRRKRNERNLVVETVTQDNTKWAHDDNFYGVLDRDRKSHINEFDEQGIDVNSYKSVQPNLEKENLDNKRAIVKNSPRKTAAGSHSIVKTKTVGFAHDEPKVEDDDVEESVNPLPTTDKMSHERTFSGKPHSNAKIKFSDSQKNESEENEDIEDSNSPNPTSKQHNGIKKVKSKDKRRDYSTHVVYSNEKDYAVYEIGSPDLWHTVHVQLFEKLSTPEGKTVWNDLTKGELASVGSITPTWTGQDLNVKYRSTKWMPKEDYLLPSESRFCLLVPISDSRVDSYASPNSSSYDTYEDSDYIVVPEEEIQGVNDDAKLTENNSEPENSVNLSENIEQTHRRVTIRASRAVIKGNENKLNIASQGSDKYLTIFHQRPLRAQIDLEARADENQLVRIGDSGRISIAVSDCTRRARTILNLQVGNTGLAAARFRVVARDCYPLLTDLTKEKEVTTSGPIMIPPRHTRSIHLELPVEIPADDAHCSVSLINDDGQSVAVRDVSIKKGDRCFCVWHCDCVCLSVDPKLMCRDMDEAGQKAAGLSTRDRVRHTRSVYCANDVSVNILTIFTGVVVFLLLMGLCKAILGLKCSCIGIWGLPLLIHGPKLDHYFEKSLCCRSVVYDEEGWPVHPDTKKRTVRVVRMPMEFVLNTIFFVCVPCMVIYDTFKLVYARYSKKKANSNSTTEAKNKDNANEIFSTHDIQEMAPRWRRRRDGLRRWMTPQAQELSTELWQRSLKIHPADYNDFMQPLLRDQRLHDNRSRMTRETPDSCMDSEQDDTEYVLTQMQKSRESLARSQKKMNNLDPPSQAPPGNMEHIKK